MKVHLIKTPEYESDNFREVYEFLSSFMGHLQFSGSEYLFPATEFDFLGHSNLKEESGVKRLLFEITMHNSLTWKQLFSLCNHYRKTFNINENDFVVLLTDRKNDLNWFSHVDSLRNVFIQTEGWENYTDINHKYPVAYEVIENIMQSLMNISPENFPSPYIHEKPKGCMNDFCEDKEQIILKLQTANICSTCIKKIHEEKIEKKIIEQVLDIFESIRKELLFRQNFRSQITPVPITINERKQILLPTLDNLEIHLNPLFKTLYIFYLQHNEGIRLNELNDYRADLLALYKKLSAGDDYQTLESRINDLANPIGGSFSQKKSKLNKIITDLLGEPLANFYRIEGEPGEPFKINLPEHLIDIRY